ncbi:LysR family transcriptional regulator [Salinivibrio sp. IB574]|uniref:LysR family transcriptional regulator n=1 Tax=unclassified Salinivibrio TaxID=2636825 RepID=UPI0009888231|nr:MULTISPECIES: LysR family transcriptional regulator [unclassified Salinivibrio]OOE73881.1 LysR family transcriptional regulator [Salinivibrio sp. ML290]OOF21222.1 LysR family transcriptional regulator [Salinivibrio sp. IB574]
MNILTLMETFAVVVDSGSFTAAADRLALSKSFVSKQVTLLERELGSRLLYRTTRKLSLSDEGARFYSHCKLIIKEAESARAEVIDSQNSPRGKVRITIPQSLIISGLGGLLFDFQSQYPDIELDVIASGRVANLVEEGVDVAIRVGQLEDSSLISRKLTDCTFQTVASPHYLETRGVPTQPKDLIQHNCLIYGESKLNKGWPYRLPNGEQITVKVSGSLTCNDGSLVTDGVCKGMGIGFGPDFLFRKYVDSGDLRVVLIDYSLPPTTISALYPHNRHLTRRVRVLIDFLAERLDVKKAKSR